MFESWKFGNDEKVAAELKAREERQAELMPRLLAAVAKLGLPVDKLEAAKDEDELMLIALEAGADFVAEMKELSRRQVAALEAIAAGAKPKTVDVSDELGELSAVEVAMVLGTRGGSIEAKIRAIKKVREVGVLPLKEAKYLVDSYWNK